MADPLSIAAGVAGLISLGLQSTEYLYKTYTTYRDRDEDLAKTADCLGDLLTVLQTIDDVILTRKWRPNEELILRNVELCISRCEDVIHELEVEVQKFKKEPQESLIKSIKAKGRRAAYPFRRSTLEKLEEDIDECRNNLQQALQAIQLKEHQNTQSDVEGLKQIMQRVQALQLNNDLRSWLNAPDATADYHAASSKRHAGTGQWFIQGQAFNSWLQEENSFLWLYGFAGSGKSVLCSAAIQYVCGWQKSHADRAVAFFFFTFNDRAKQDISSLLRALLMQLSGQIPGLDDDLVRLKKSANDGLCPSSKLLECLRDALARTRQAYILVDALDECPEGKLRDGALETIEVMRRWSLPSLHLLVTSRDIFDIREALQAPEEVTIPLNNDEVREDIRKYVSDCVECDPKLRRWKDDRQVIKDYLVERADGVFRWVDCQLEPLRRCPKSKFDLDRCLNTLPASLDETYERMLYEIDTYSQERAKRILTLLCLTERTMFVSEILEAIAVDTEDKECYDADRKLDNADDLLRICPGLIDVLHLPQRDFGFSEDQLSSTDDSLHPDDYSTYLNEYTIYPDEQTIRLAHFSVKEYLISDRIKHGRAAHFSISAKDGHAQICKSCLIYLCDEDFLKQNMAIPAFFQQYSLGMFAAQNWSHHFRLAEVETRSKLMAWALKFCQNRAACRRWIDLYNLDGKMNHTTMRHEITVKKRPSMFYYAALLGLDRLLSEFLLNHDVDIRAREGFHGNALVAAVAGGHENAVKTLLNAGADVNVRGLDLGNALQVASANGYDKIVQILLDARAEVDAQAGYFGTALQTASAFGQDTIVHILLQAGADVNARGGHYTYALRAASAKGQAAVVRQLIDAGAHINAVGGRYNDSALYVASSKGRTSVVRILLEANADPNLPGGVLGSALCEAIDRGSKKIVKLLLDAGANASFVSSSNEQPLNIAARTGRDQIARMLLDAGADADAKDPFNDALFVAAKRGGKEIVRMLLDAGVDVNSQKTPRKSALLAACTAGHSDVVEMLLDAGTNVNLHDEEFQQALSVVTAMHFDDIAQMLTQAGAGDDAVENSLKKPIPSELSID